MTERPLLFSAPMVRATLDDSKTQTRRVVKKQFAADAIPAEVSATTPEGWQTVGHSGLWWDDGSACLEDAIHCPYGIPGDGLWVREAWTHDAESLEQCRAAHEDAMGGGTYGPYYRATEKSPDTLRWRPSIHMPRWASRITLEVTGVRVERLQDISEADAIAEGCAKNHNGYFWGGPHAVSGLKQLPTATAAYRDLWQSLYGADSWDANPWVWVVEFRRVAP